MMDDPVVIVGGARTPIGRFGGALKDVDASDLAGVAIAAALERAGVASEDVDEVIMGQVGQVGADAYNARRCAIAGGIPVGATAMNVNRLCGSGLQAIVTGAGQLLLGDAVVIVAGGDESMSRQPFLDYGARAGWRLGARELVDGTLSLVTDPFGSYPMGETAERVAERYAITREDQDRFAVRSQTRAGSAITAGHVDPEIVSVAVPRQTEPVSRDEHPRPGATLEELADLRPAFRTDGSVTAGNASGINDGAAAVVLMRESEALRRGLTPRLRYLGSAVSGIEPDIMGYAPALAIPKVLKKLNLEPEQLDVIELNEAFAAQAVAVIRAAGLDEDALNPMGGAIAFGHPVGATGAILTIRLMYELERMQLGLGMVTMCIGGGQGIAAVFESPAAAREGRGGTQ
jgi:acetyl-CoA C-acetyltransferase